MKRELKLKVIGDSVSVGLFDENIPPIPDNVVIKSYLNYSNIGYSVRLAIMLAQWFNVKLYNIAEGACPMAHFYHCPLLPHSQHTNVTILETVLPDEYLIPLSNYYRKKSDTYILYYKEPGSHYKFQGQGLRDSFFKYVRELEDSEICRKGKCIAMDRELSFDNIHPNATGHDHLARKLFFHITRTLIINKQTYKNNMYMDAYCQEPNKHNMRIIKNNGFELKQYSYKSMLQSTSDDSSIYLRVLYHKKISVLGVEYYTDDISSNFTITYNSTTYPFATIALPFHWNKRVYLPLDSISNNTVIKIQGKLRFISIFYS
jgi:hypothetical protein